MSDIDDDIADLVGAPRSKRDQVLDDLVAAKRQGRTNYQTGGPLVEDMLAGVTVSWLSQVFSMDPKTVKQKLADCPPLHRRKAGYVYNLAVACRYLIPPAISVDQFVKTMKPSDLPAAFQETFWAAALKRQKWEENAGQLWRTDQVREVLSEVFKTIKFTVQLWADTIEQQKGLTDEQRKLLNTMTDKLLDQVYKGLLENAKKKRTNSQRAEMAEVLGDPVETDGMELV